MRIISGRYRGRQFKSPPGHRTHPMSDKVRGALFNALGDVSGLNLLDAFAGSGAISLEAVSRGAQSALAIDSDKAAHRTIQENINSLGLSSVKATRANIVSWSDNNARARFDLIICDPPYDKLSIATIANLSRHLSATGLLVLSWPGRQSLPELASLTLINAKDYGDAQLGYYQKAV